MMGLPRSVADALDAVTYSQRALAYLQVDAELKLVGAAGNLENYGLGAVRLGEPALGQAVFLEGLLPLPETPYFMPSIELGWRARRRSAFLPGRRMRLGGAARCHRATRSDATHPAESL